MAVADKATLITNQGNKLTQDKKPLVIWVVVDVWEVAAEAEEEGN